MRFFHWAGTAALAATVGYLSSAFVHRCALVPEKQTRNAVDMAEVSEVGPLGALTPPRSPVEEPRLERLEPVEVIDLECVPEAIQFRQFVQTTEPPLAEPALLPAGLRTVHFEFPAGASNGPEAPLTLPYLTDDPADAPAKLPPLGDVPPVLPPGTIPHGPIFDAVWKFFREAVLPVTDQVPLGQPPVSERPPTPEVGG